jgi:hypothetical protein
LGKGHKGNGVSGRTCALRHANPGPYPSDGPIRLICTRSETSVARAAVNRLDQGICQDAAQPDSSAHAVVRPVADDWELRRNRFFLGIHRPITEGQEVIEQGVNHRRTQEPGHYGRGNWDPGGKDPPEDRGRQRERPEAGIHDSRPAGGGRRVTGVCILTAVPNRGKGRVQKWVPGCCRSMYELRVR